VFDGGDDGPAHATVVAGTRSEVITQRKVIMKIVVIGGTALIGSKVVANLVEPVLDPARNPVLRVRASYRRRRE
jgi:hypothetical protein